MILIITSLMILIKFGTCLDLCDDNPEVNLTSYLEPKIQNCGCQETVCIRKCCRAGFFLSKKRVCRRSNHSSAFRLQVYQNTVQPWKTVENAEFLVGVLECPYYKFNNSDPGEAFFVQQDGRLWVPGHKMGVYYKNTDYCVDQTEGVSVFVCFPTDASIGRNINVSGMIISMPFLLITFLVYAVLPDRNLHQKALMFYVLALLISYILLVTINLSDGLGNGWCSVFAYSTLFFFMVSFFWMNVICFDIWYTFSGGRGFVKRTSERKRLIFYAIYAFGVPILVILLVILMQNVLPVDSEHHPGIGESKCFLKDGWPNLWYFYGEAGILVIANIIFFLLTAFKIRKIKKETSVLKQTDSKRHNYEKDKQKFNLYVKLLFAMGVNWSMEVISWLVNWRAGTDIQYIWYATDFCNAVYGVFIFFIFVFKRKIWNLLRRRYYTFIGKPHLAQTVTLSNFTRTSHYSTTDTSLAERASAANGRTRPEELALRNVN